MVASGFLPSRDGALLPRVAQAFGVTPSASQQQSLARYVELVATWNKKLDLTAARDAEALVEVMLADAFALAAPDLIPAASRCVDVGSGAGAPAVPLALLREDLSFLLVEPQRKRVAFLRTVLGSLQLTTRVSVVEQKLQPETPALREAPFDVAMSRATFAPELWLRAGRQLAPRTLVLLASQPLPATDGLIRAVDYQLPFSGAARRVAAYAAANASA